MEGADGKTLALTVVFGLDAVVSTNAYKTPAGDDER
jgi:hypothetical protein